MEMMNLNEGLGDVAARMTAVVRTPASRVEVGSWAPDGSFGGWAHEVGTAGVSRIERAGDLVRVWRTRGGVSWVTVEVPWCQVTALDRAEPTVRQVAEAQAGLDGLPRATRE